MVDSKYLRCGVVRRKEKNNCVPKAPSAEQVSERYSNEAAALVRVAVWIRRSSYVLINGAIRNEKKRDLCLCS